MAFGIDPAQLQQLQQGMAELPADDRAAMNADALDSMDERHLVDFAEECVRHTQQEDSERIKKWEILWDAHENKIKDYAEKEDYQSQIVTNEPYAATVQATSLVRRAVIDKPDYFTGQPRRPEDQKSQVLAQFWEKALRYWTSLRDSRMPSIYPDMTQMGFAVGVTSAVKALWQTMPDGREGLRLAKIDPWKIFRDPDCRPRQPQSGLYCIHQDYIDLYQLYAGEDAGIYKNTRLVKEGREGSNIHNVNSAQKSKERKSQINERSKYRKAALVTEYWGDILDKNGELVASNQTFTVANGILIRGPIDVPLPTCRWPIHQFSPLPHLLRFYGYGLYEGVMPMWRLQNNLLNLFVDGENWRLNQPFEVDPLMLENPADVELMPGKLVRVKAGAHQSGGRAYIPIQIDSRLEDLKVVWDLVSTAFEKGSFVTELVKGEIGESKRTAREVEVKTQQSLGVFDNIGKDVEAGGTQLLEMIQDVLCTYWDEFDSPGYADIFGPEMSMLLNQLGMPMHPEQRMQMLKLDIDWQIRSVTEMFDKAQKLDRVMNFVQMTDSPRFMPYVDDYVILKDGAEALDMERGVKDEQRIIQEQQMLAQADAAAMAAGMPPQGAGGPPQGGPQQGPTRPGGPPFGQTPGPPPSAQGGASELRQAA